MLWVLAQSSQFCLVDIKVRGATELFLGSVVAGWLVLLLTLSGMASIRLLVFLILWRVEVGSGFGFGHGRNFCEIFTLKNGNFLKIPVIKMWICIILSLYYYASSIDRSVTFFPWKQLGWGDFWGMIWSCVSRGCSPFVEVLISRENQPDPEMAPRSQWQVRTPWEWRAPWLPSSFSGFFTGGFSSLIQIR